MKPLWIAVVALGLAATSRAGEFPRPDSAASDFRRAARDGQKSVPEMVARLKAAMAPKASPGEADSPWFVEIFTSATLRANGEEMDKLGKILQAMPKGWVFFDDCFSAYTTAQIRHRVTQLAKKPVHLEWKPSSEALPKEMADAPAGLRAAWQQYRSVLEPCRTALEPLATAGYEGQKVPAIEVDLRRMIGHPQPGAWKHLGLHIWGIDCGTGSESLYHPRNRAILLSFLADEKWREAAGAVLCQVPSLGPTDGKGSSGLLAVDLLSAVGLDWEEVMLGSLLPVWGAGQANVRPHISSGFRECDAWHLLAVRGSERGVRQCLELIRWAKLDPRSAMAFLAAALNVEEEKAEPMAFSRWPQLVRNVALPEPCRKEVLAVLAGYLATANPPEDLVEALGQVPVHLVKELRDPINALVAHRAHAVAVRALGLLERAKLATGQEQIAPATPPLHFRLLLNGQPLKGAKVSVEAFGKKVSRAKVSPAAAGGEGTSPDQAEPAEGEALVARSVAPSQNLTTDGNGVMTYCLEQVLDAAQIDALQIRIKPAQLSAAWEPLVPGLPPEVAPPPRENEWPGPWLLQEVQALVGDEQVREVALATADLEIQCEGFAGMPPKLPLKIRLRRADSGHPFTSPEWDTAVITAKAGRPVFFRQLQPGKYLLAVTGKGVATYESGEITVGQGARPHLVKLEAGRNVRGLAIFPNGEKGDLGWFSQLFRDGVEIPEAFSDRWEGLRLGHYTLRIPSTLEREEAAKKEGIQVRPPPKDERHGAREVTFVLDASSPATLDLGKIQLPREKR